VSAPSFNAGSLVRVVLQGKKFVKSIGPVYRWINRTKGVRIHEETHKRPHVVLGSEYGQWAVDHTLLSADSLIYAVGVGEDVTFDCALIDLIGCTVHAFDPTPIAIDWIANQNLPSQFEFHPIGIGASDSTVEFHVPPIAGWHSYSLTAEQDAAQTGTVSCEIRRLSTIMADLGHRNVDVLKMDIEGFEYSVIDDILLSETPPKQILVEFHHGMYTHSASDTKYSVDKLMKFGYQLFWVSDLGREYAFVYNG
jgi:FkbM family methyltransferase